MATPTLTHPDVVEAALAAGLHVLCEKPLSLDAARGDRLGAIAAQHGRVLQTGFWRRFSPPWRMAKQHLDRNEIGTPLLLRLAQWDGDPPPPAFCDPAVSGGLAVDCGVHEYDLAEWLTRRSIRRVSAWTLPAVDGGVREAGDVDNLVAVLELDGGAVATVDLSRNARFGDDIRTEILGSDGALLIDALPAGRTRIGTRAGMRVLPGSEVGRRDGCGRRRADPGLRRRGARGAGRDPGRRGERAGDPHRSRSDRGGAHGTRRRDRRRGAAMTVSRQVVVHQDDVGMCHGANVAFLELARRGIITSGSVMVPCPWFPEIAAAAADPALDLGVHLTLTSEKEHYRWGPLTGPAPGAGLTDGDGYLWRDVASVRRHADPAAVATELRAQVERALAAGIDVTHLDAHMGTALAPEFCAAYLALGVEYRLPILLTRTLHAYGPSVPHLVGVSEADYAAYVDRRGRSTGCRCSTPSARRRGIASRPSPPSRCTATCSPASPPGCRSSPSTRTHRARSRPSNRNRPTSARPSTSCSATSASARGSTSSTASSSSGCAGCATSSAPALTASVWPISGRSAAAGTAFVGRGRGEQRVEGLDRHPPGPVVLLAARRPDQTEQVAIGADEAAAGFAGLDIGAQLEARPEVLALAVDVGRADRRPPADLGRLRTGDTVVRRPQGHVVVPVVLVTRAAGRGRAHRRG